MALTQALNYDHVACAKSSTTLQVEVACLSSHLGSESRTRKSKDALALPMALTGTDSACVQLEVFFVSTTTTDSARDHCTYM